MTEVRPEGEHPLADAHSFITADIAQILVHKKIGGGCFREVFSLRHSKDLVLKVRRADSNEENFSNVVEWETWNEAVGTDLEKWLAPCVSISRNGQVLVQKRTTPFTRDDKRLPRHVPAFLWDLKPSNWGWFEGRPVCHDYGNRSLLPPGKLKLRDARREWRK